MKMIGRMFPAVILLLVFFFTGPAGQLYAQSGSSSDGAATDDEQQALDVAILLKGPDPGERLPFFHPNSIEHYVGRYTFRNQEISVYYTKREIVRFEEWTPVSCGRIQLFEVAGPASGSDASTASPRENMTQDSDSPAASTGSVAPAMASGPDSGGPAVYFFSNDAYSLFFSFERELLCSFTERFILRFDYFRSVQNIPSKRPPFPAIVE